MLAEKLRAIGNLLTPFHLDWIQIEVSSPSLPESQRRKSPAWMASWRRWQGPAPQATPTR